MAMYCKVRLQTSKFHRHTKSMNVYPDISMPFDIFFMYNTLQLARLSEDDMRPVVNMEYMGVSVSKQQPGGFALKFGGKKVRIQRLRIFLC